LELTPSDAEVLKPLFVDLANRRALLRSPIGRPVEHAAYVQASVEQIRGQLVETRKLLDGGGDAAEWIDSMTRACRSYLDAVETYGPETDVAPNFEPALRELREFFRGAAVHFANDYNSVEARGLVKEMYEEDLRRLEAEMEHAGVGGAEA
jgi:hypothetical protein